MAIVVDCARCRKQHSFPDNRAGQWTSCPTCGTSLFLSPLLQQEEPPLLETVDEGEPPRSQRTEKTPPHRRFPEPDLEDEEDEGPRHSRRRTGRPSYRKPPDVYIHRRCGGSTKISSDIVSWFTADPFRPVSSTYCCGCRRYVSLSEVVWPETGESVAAYRSRLRSEMPLLLVLVRLLLGPLAVAGMGAGVGALLLLRQPAVGAFFGLGIGLLLGFFIVGTLFQLCRDCRRIVQ